MNKFRKLKEYSNLGKYNVTIFNLMDTTCEFWYDDKTYRPGGSYWYKDGIGEYDFLLEYYVVGIIPKYRIENDKIIPYIHITLKKEVENDESI